VTVAAARAVGFSPAQHAGKVGGFAMVPSVPSRTIPAPRHLPFNSQLVPFGDADWRCHGDASGRPGPGKPCTGSVAPPWPRSTVSGSTTQGA